MNRKLFLKEVLFYSFALIMVLVYPVDSHARKYYRNKTQTFHVNGVAVTGFNEVCGEAVVNLPLPPPLSPDFHGAFIGEYDTTQGAIDAIPFTPTNCNPNSLVATTTDPVYRDAFGFPDPDSRLKNIPLRKVPTTVTFDDQRSELSSIGVFPPNPFPPTKNQSNDPITLGDWLSARGNMTIVCKSDGSASVVIRMRKLIPDSIYSAIAVWNTTPPFLNQPTVFPLPFGGVPNIFVTDAEGNGVFKRRLAACPMDPTPDGSRLLFVDIGFHSANTVSGAVPVPLFETKTFIQSDGSTFRSAIGPGTAAHDQLDFFIATDNSETQK
ncbi:MAG: hypothetical protein CTY34_04050 [Methylobacter sp.]|nr:MAG: hypothetical protein CTY34_04050 [Methylobacter sp.]PPD19465.1 MAG: hypothetical protein CTY24_10820 [Methylobacter sp.]PPD35404.1 MAG: hypothetical protein CTY18_06180 [Methylomonas sp.]